MWDIILDSVLDTAKLLPFLLLTYIAMEYLEHRAGAATVGLVCIWFAAGALGAFLTAMLGGPLNGGLPSARRRALCPSVGSRQRLPACMREG